jgi:hypothetical protein
MCNNYISQQIITQPSAHKFNTERPISASQIGFSHETRNEANQIPLNSYSYFNHNEKKAFENFSQVLSFTSIIPQVQMSCGKIVEDLSVKDSEEIQNRLKSMRGPVKCGGSKCTSIMMLK